jgi:hypothetical protein
MSRLRLTTFVVSLIITFAVTTQTANAQLEDTTHPDLAQFDFNPKTVDVGGGQQNVVLTLRITDDLSGFEFGNFLFISPSGQQVLAGGINAPHRISGNALDGIYEVTATVPQFSEAGTWRVIQIFLRDVVGNTTVFNESDLIGRGFPTQLNVEGGPDLVAPNLAEFSFSPATIDVSAGSQNVTLTLRIVDSLSGFEFGNFLFISPSGQQVNAGGINAPHRVSGDSRDGVYEVSTTFPQFSEAGTWRIIQIFMRDVVGNTAVFNEADLISRGFPSQLQVVADPQDVIAPTLTEFSVAPGTIDTSTAPRTVTLTLRITDNLSGFEFGNFLFISPSGQQVNAGGINAPHRISGNSTDGVYEVVTTFPQFSEVGTWRLIQIFMRDVVGNTAVFSEQDLASRGFPNTLIVAQGCDQLTALGPARAWIGLKNSDDVGTKFDLHAEVLRNGVVVGSGQLDNVSGGSSGFNNALARTIGLALTGPVNVCPGDTVGLKLSVRIAAGVSGHRSGTARLWFNDSAADSQFSATIGGTTTPSFLLNAFALGSVAGPGPKKTIDVFVDRAVGGNPFKPFGTWSRTY